VVEDVGLDEGAVAGLGLAVTLLVALSPVLADFFLSASAAGVSVAV
jgi:hypothetical protein